jgi:hypothetical protein
VVPRRGGFRVACNRDERRSRPPAAPPAFDRIGGLACLFPADPAAGGTWIALNEAGLVMVLLNRTPRIEKDAGLRRRAPAASRGLVIPRLLAETGLGDAVAGVRRIPASRFAAFTLLIIQGSALAVVTNAVGGIHVRMRRLEKPLLFTSSSLGDEVVIPARRRLFQKMVTRASSAVAGQRAFHRHRWTGRPEISVLMERPDARTVSRTVVDVSPAAGLRMTYTPLPE